jgi:hypothetical protein
MQTHDEELASLLRSWRAASSNGIWQGEKGENEGNMPGSLYANRTAAKRIGELGRSVAAAAGVRGAKHGPLSLSLINVCTVDFLMHREHFKACMLLHMFIQLELCYVGATENLSVSYMLGIVVGTVEVSREKLTSLKDLAISLLFIF